MEEEDDDEDLVNPPRGCWADNDASLPVICRGEEAMPASRDKCDNDASSASSRSSPCEDCDRRGRFELEFIVPCEMSNCCNTAACDRGRKFPGRLERLATIHSQGKQFIERARVRRAQHVYPVKSRSFRTRGRPTCAMNDCWISVRKRASVEESNGLHLFPFKEFRRNLRASLLSRAIPHTP